MPYGGGYSDLSSKIKQLNQYNFIKNSRKGAILIEFAFAVPVLFSLIYYIQDLSHLKQMEERMKFVATEMAGILQNISQNRTNKTITLNDIKYAAATAYLSFFPGKTIYTIAHATSPLGYSCYGLIHCVKGQPNKKASVLWSFRFFSSENSDKPLSITTMGRDSRSLISLGTNVDPSAIYKDLTINDGEIKIIVEAAIHCSNGYKISADKTVGQAGGQAKVLGFYVYPFRGYFGNVYLNSISIFTPKPGLFSETMPQ